MRKALAAAKARMAKSNCFIDSAVDDPGVSGADVALNHHWNRLQVGLKSVDIDPWPSGGEKVIDSSEAVKHPGAAITPR